MTCEPLYSSLYLVCSPLKKKGSLPSLQKFPTNCREVQMMSAVPMPLDNTWLQLAIYTNLLSPGIQLLVTNGLKLSDGCLYTYSIYGLVITWNTVTCNEWANVK